MKNILTLFNGIDYSPHVLNFGILIAKESHSLLHPIFLKPMHEEESLQYPFPNDLSHTRSPFSKKDLEKEDMKSMDTNLQVFIDECRLNNVSYKPDKRLETIGELIELTAFTDTVLVDAKSRVGKYSMIELLTDAHCPVMLVPAAAQPPEEIILSYDGSLSSIYAIKMYSYLFPEWENKTTRLLSINHEKKDEGGYDACIDDWLNQHFSNLTKHEVEGHVHKELIKFIQNDSEKKLIVMGAFGRNSLSRLLHRSLAARVIEETNASLFITHQ